MISYELQRQFGYFTTQITRIQNRHLLKQKISGFWISNIDFLFIFLENQKRKLNTTNCVMMIHI